eukprot:TRINITY_DN6168_c0_g1_i1.p1 TRINITY_DN6168_c0_g1~~TRINITY_DN6168_c0_g1_i1.p1  ORF type:complete len:398 (+),score=96.46 TRINITY_DN6168_c0_g1_i1:136-1194(+)
MAGAAAGISEHCAMYPIDSVKTQMQSLDCDKGFRRGILSSLSGMVREEGLIRPFRGFSAMALGSGPAHALYFSSYEQIKTVLGSSNSIGLPSVWIQGIAGVGATICHDSLMSPAEVVKQRMQMCCSKFSSASVAIRSIYHNEGLRAFYRSFLTSLSMNIPYQVSHFWTYELFTSLLNPGGLYNPGVHFVAGALAGAVASTVTMPLDVCKTLLNTQEPAVLKRVQASQIVGLRRAAGLVYSLKGLSGFFQGLQARIVYQMPATAISWSVYEFFKQYLKSRRPDSADHFESAADYMSRSSTSSSVSGGGGGCSNEIVLSTKFKSSDNWGTLGVVPSLMASSELVLQENEFKPKT